MPTAIAMPRLGMTMTEGRVVEWPLEIGARVERGDVVLIIESDKSEIEVEATGSGALAHVYVEPDETVACGTLLAALVEADETGFDPEAFLESWQSEPTPADEVARAGPARKVAQRHAAPRRPLSGRTPVTPAARKLAAKLDIDASTLRGSGPGGRVTREDVGAAAAARQSLVPVAEGVALEVPSLGEGDPVLLLPGFGTDVSAFSAQIPVLAEGYEVRGVNPRGVGMSDAPEAAAYDVATSAADVAALIEAPAHVVGASLGAGIALELALAHPEKVRTLTLLTPLVEVSSRLAAVSDGWCRLATEVEPEALAQSLLPWFFGSTTLNDAKRSGQIVRGLATTLARVSADALPRIRAGMLAWSGSRRADLSRIAAPTLVLVAEEDLLIPDAAATGAAIPGARVEVVPGAGHAVGLEAPDAVNRAILERLRS